STHPSASLRAARSRRPSLRDMPRMTTPSSCASRLTLRMGPTIASAASRPHGRDEVSLRARAHVDIDVLPDLSLDGVRKIRAHPGLQQLVFPPVLGQAP